MARVRGVAVCLGILVCGQAVAEEPRHGERVALTANYVYVPVAVMADDGEVKIAVDGYLPSGCYQVASPQIAVNVEEKSVRITPRARYFDVPCVEALVPYSVEAKIDHLSEGEYTVEVPSDGGLLSEHLVVTRHHAVANEADE